MHAFHSSTASSGSTIPIFSFFAVYFKSPATIYLLLNELFVKVKPSPVLLRRFPQRRRLRRFRLDGDYVDKVLSPILRILIPFPTSFFSRMERYSRRNP